MAIIFRHPAFKEVVEARRLIEVETAALAATRRSMEDLRTLDEIMQRMSSHLDSPRRASAADLEFHIAMAQASHNGVLVYLINTMRGLLELWVYKAFSDSHIEIPAIIQEHNAVLEAVTKKNTTAASSLMGQHIDEASKRLFRVISPDEPLSQYAKLLLLARDGLDSEREGS
jgi:GntR family transcriptional repressor for pyruvate dehydrogenase complex